jgi:molecular chaperone GrpE (heat shock protein)
MDINDIKKQISDLTLRQGKVEKEIQAANAKHEAHLQMLNTEFGIDSIDKIQPMIDSLTSQITGHEDTILKHLESLKKHVEGLEKTLNGK